jgi:esterase
MGAIPLEKILEGKALDSFPVLFVKGELSGYITTLQEEFIYRYFPKASLETIAGAGHWVHAEQPGLFLDVVTVFLKSA